MTRLKTIVSISFMILPTLLLATTWNEPWQDKVIQESDYFVFAKVLSSDDKSVTIEIIKSLGGQELKGTIKITNFYLLELCSSSGGHGPEFYFSKIDECYFFLKKNSKGEYCIATPTAGFASVRDGNVTATYRHSYHQARVPADVYEKTMIAIFNNYHHLPYDKSFITDYVQKYLSLKPSGHGAEEIETFFAQHVALECVYHLRLDGFYSSLPPFLRDTANFHTQISAARAMIAYNTPECKQELVKVIGDTTSINFVQVMCIWTLGEFKPRELKQQLVSLEQTASEEQNGFGGNIMDPRVCTYIPNVKNALHKLIETL